MECWGPKTVLQYSNTPLLPLLKYSLASSVSLTSSRKFFTLALCLLPTTRFC
jgi:hypothetical protein